MIRAIFDPLFGSQPKREVVPLDCETRQNLSDLGAGQDDFAHLFLCSKCSPHPYERQHVIAFHEQPLSQQRFIDLLWPDFVVVLRCVGNKLSKAVTARQYRDGSQVTNEQLLLQLASGSVRQITGGTRLRDAKPTFLMPQDNEVLFVRAVWQASLCVAAGFLARSAQFSDTASDRVWDATVEDMVDAFPEEQFYVGEPLPDADAHLLGLCIFRRLFGRHYTGKHSFIMDYVTNAFWLEDIHENPVSFGLLTGINRVYQLNKRNGVPFWWAQLFIDALPDLADESVFRAAEDRRILIAAR